MMQCYAGVVRFISYEVNCEYENGINEIENKYHMQILVTEIFVAFQ